MSSASAAAMVVPMLVYRSSSMRVAWRSSSLLVLVNLSWVEVYHGDRVFGRWCVPSWGSPSAGDIAFWRVAVGNLLPGGLHSQALLRGGNDRPELVERRPPLEDVVGGICVNN